MVNRKNQPVDTTATFRILSRAPEFWDADTGETRPVSFKIQSDGIEVPLKLQPFQSVFVVFRKPTTVPFLTLPDPSTRTVQSLTGAWSISFQADRGAPASVTKTALTSWSEDEDHGVKYFSGAGTYTKTFELAQQTFRVGKLKLDLGKVYELADVSLNGKHVGTVWHEPFVLDISSAAKPGKNVLKIAVINLWVNRLIGDQQPNNQKKYTFTVIPTYKPDAPLRPSGLLGPVKILQDTTH